MKFVYNRKDTLPSLSWLAEIKKGNDDIKVFCGDKVECQQNFFVSGVWDGEFLSAEFDTCNFSCCTGCKIADGKSFIAVTPNHFQENIYSIKIDKSLFLSNSLAFLLEYSGISLDNNRYDYDKILCSNLWGRNSCNKLQLSKHLVIIHKCCCINISSDLKVEETKKFSNFRFNSYSDYIEGLKITLKKISLNAKDNNRRISYKFISSISKGYDAPAVSALVKDVGCDNVITFAKPAKYSSDNGADIAKILGYKNIIIEDADRFKNNTNLIEAEAASTSDSGSMIVFHGFEELLSDGLFFMGLRGDSIWEKNNDNVNNNYDFSCGNGLSQSSVNIESGLRNNTIMIYVPLIGADHWTDIHKISNSEEMALYSVGGNYDRPIPRRIVESKGVDRNSFGIKKAGAGISYYYDTLSRIQTKMSPNSYSSLLSYLKNSKRNKVILKSKQFSFFLKESPIYFNYVMKKLHISLRLKRKENYNSSPLNSMMILWGIHEMRKRYKF